MTFKEMEAISNMYAAYKVLAFELKRDYPDSKLYKQYNLKDA